MRLRDSHNSSNDDLRSSLIVVEIEDLHHPTLRSKFDSKEKKSKLHFLSTNYLAISNPRANGRLTIDNTIIVAKKILNKMFGSNNFMIKIFDFSFVCYHQ